MWPILLCSIVAVAITAERTIYYLAHALNLVTFSARLEEPLRRGEIEAARRIAEAERNPVATLAAQYLAHLKSGLSIRENVLTRQLALGVSQASARLRGLEIIAQVAPLLGLLGTVTGMIGAFHDLQDAGGAVHVGTLASGIWSALLTTAFGLSVAIPTMLAHHHFVGLVERMQEQMQYVLSWLNEVAAEGLPGVEPVEPVALQPEIPVASAVG